MKLIEVSKLESILTDLGKCQEEAGVIMTDAKYIFEASVDCEARIKDISDRLNKLIQDKFQEESNGGKSK